MTSQTPMETRLAAIAGTVEHQRSAYIPADDLAKLHRVGWRVRDVVPRKGLCVIWGAPGSGKSFLVLDLSLAIARALPNYHGKRIRPGVVIYLAMEGNLTDRVEAYKRNHQLPDGMVSNLIVKHGTVNFMSFAEVEAECAAIRDVIGDREVAAIVVDTLARAMPGGNENGSDSMGAVIGGFKYIENYFNTCVIALHHCGKNADSGMRGHSSLLGALDAEIEVRRNGDDPIRTVYIGKQKDGQDHFELFNFRLESIVLGKTSRWDEDAEPDEIDSSCVVVGTDELPTAPSVRQTRNGTIFERALEYSREITGDIRQEDVRKQYYLLHTGNSDAKRQGFNRDWKRFMDKATAAVNQAERDK